jgi:hypothetical protein
MTTSCKRHGVAPIRYLADVHRRLPTTPPDRLAELLADVWFRAHRKAAGKPAA